MLFVSVDDGPTRSLLRVESGFALALSAAYRNWFLLLEPLSIDFRYLLMTRDDSQQRFLAHLVAGGHGRPRVLTQKADENIR